MLLGTGVVSVDRQPGAHRGFLGLQADDDDRLCGGGILSCVFVRDFLAVRGLAVVMLLLGKLMVDTGRPHLGRIAVRGDHPSMGVCVRSHGNLVHHHAVETARHSDLGDGDGGAHAALERYAASIRNFYRDPRPDRIPRDVT